MDSFKFAIAVLFCVNYKGRLSHDLCTVQYIDVQPLPLKMSQVLLLYVGNTSLGRVLVTGERDTHTFFWCMNVLRLTEQQQLW